MGDKTNLEKLVCVVLVITMFLVTPILVNGAEASSAEFNLVLIDVEKYEDGTTTVAVKSEDETITAVIEFEYETVGLIDMVNLNIIGNANPADYGIVSPCGGRRTFLTVTGRYTFDNLRSHAYGVDIIQWFFFDGQEHHSDLEGYIDVCWLDGQVATWWFSLTADWHDWFMPLGWGWSLQVKEEYRASVDYLHAYAELQESGFPTLFYDKYFYGNNDMAGDSDHEQEPCLSYETYE